MPATNKKRDYSISVNLEKVLNAEKSRNVLKNNNYSELHSPSKFKETPNNADLKSINSCDMSSTEGKSIATMFKSKEQIL